MSGYVDSSGTLYFDDDNPGVITRNGEDYIRQPDGSYVCAFNGDQIRVDIPQTRERPEADPVDHPSHYETGCGFECIDVLLETQGAESVKGFCLCNAMKYLYRHGRKNGDEDVRKARWYIDKYLELAEG